MTFVRLFFCGSLDSMLCFQGLGMLRAQIEAYLGLITVSIISVCISVLLCFAKENTHRSEAARIVCPLCHRKRKIAQRVPSPDKHTNFHWFLFIYYFCMICFCNVPVW